MNTQSNPYQDEFWIKSYPKDVAPEVDVDQYSNIVEIFLETCKRSPEAPAFENYDVTMTYAEVDRLSDQLAAYFKHKLQLKKGERVAVMMPNLMQYPVTILAILKAGLVVVNMNPLYKADEIKHQLNDAGAETIIVLDNFIGELLEVLPQTTIKHVVVTRFGDLLGSFKGAVVNFVVRYIKRLVPSYQLKNKIIFKEALRFGESVDFVMPALQPNDLAFLQYTGGTTGTPKSAMLSHGNMVANVLQCIAWIKPIVEEDKEIVLTALPLYHIFSLTVCCLCFMKLGGKSLLITNPRDMNGFVKILRKSPITIFVGLNTLFNGLLNHPDFHKINFKPYKLTIAGGMAVQRVVADCWQQTTGIPIIEGYGLTEASPVVSINPVTQKHFNGSIGLPVPDTRIEVRNEELQVMPVGEVGNLWVHGPQVMQGYWQQPQQTADVIDKDGWLNTGDSVKVDEEGYIYVVGRTKDMILVSGFNVYPNEIEDVIAKMPEVKEVAVVGVPSDRTGEAVKAFIVRKDPKLTAEQVIAYCREHLTGYKIPKLVEFRDDLPKSNVGKVLRRKLR